MTDDICHLCGDPIDGDEAPEAAYEYLHVADPMHEQCAEAEAARLDERDEALEEDAWEAARELAREREDWE